MLAQKAQPASRELMDVAARIHELREISGYSQEQMAQYTNVSLTDYIAYESARADMPFTFIHKCALTFNVGITDLMQGRSARLSSYTVTRRDRLRPRKRASRSKIWRPFSGIRSQSPIG